MKRRAFIQHLQQHGCMLVREGGNHSWWVNPAKNKRSSVPRHVEVTLRIIFATLVFAVALWTIAQTLTAQREFPHSGKVRVACNVQDDIGGEGLRSGELEVE